MNKKALRKIAKRLAKEAAEAAEVERQLEALPPEMRSLGGPIAAMLSVFGPPQFQAGARRVMLERAFSDTRAHVARKQFKRVK